MSIVFTANSVKVVLSREKLFVAWNQARQLYSQAIHVIVRERAYTPKKIEGTLWSDNVMAPKTSQ